MFCGKEATQEEPQKKKMKLEEKPPSPKPRMECVLGDDVLKELPLVEVYIGTILDKKNISQIIVQLNSIHPVPSLQHLRRVKDGKEVILCLVENIKNINEFLDKINFDLSTISSDIKKVFVPAEPPRTRSQFLDATKKWSCNFHEDKYLEKLVRNLYSEKEMDLHEKWMRMALNCKGTVIVDPKDNSMKGMSADLREEHPMKHSVMVAIDNVARGQGGGAWGTPTGTVIHDRNNDDGPYLCTGYHVYTITEPCVMCAMALVHSRANKVFYSRPSEDGALGTLTKLHCIKNLNHHFEVYKGLLLEECSKLIDNV